MASPTIASIYGTKTPKPWTSAKALPLPNPMPNLLYGVELEIENCNEEWRCGGFTVVQDGSLRNGGLEFISTPMTYSNLVYALDVFFDRNKPVEIKHEDEYSMDSNYSDRTSIHVHTNVNDLTFEQLTTLCLIYEVFENLLFAFIGNDRDKNIFCVPWKETTLSYATLEKLQDVNKVGSVVKSWQKYTALNLLPITKQGSIEWRHMHGNSNRDMIYTWLRIIGHIYKYAVDNTFEDTKKIFMGLNTTSEYDHMLNRVFQYDSDRLRVDQYHPMLEDGVLNMKYSMMEEPKLSSKKVISAPRIDEFEDINRRLNRLRDNGIIWAGAVAPDARIPRDVFGNNPNPAVNIELDRDGRFVIEDDIRGPR